MKFADLYPGIGQPPVTTTRPPKRVAKTLQTPSVGGKGTAAYLAHSYPTKVPPEAIEPYLLHHTRPGDLVLDPFCGSGMTGLAALRTGRNAVLNDLGVGAVHLASNMTRRMRPERLVAGAASVMDAVRPAFDAWYAAEGQSGGQGTLDWMLWSETYRCGKCGEVTALWDSAVDRERGVVEKEWLCPSCGAAVSARHAERAGSVPAWASVTDTDGRFEREPTSSDLELLLDIEGQPIEDWYPQVPLGPDREMFIRSALHLQGVDEVADFWTPRNLRAVAHLWAAIAQVADTDVRQTLAFAFTNTVWHATRMRRFNAAGGQRPLTGTLYIPQLSIEVNPLNVFANKIRQLARFYKDEIPGGVEAQILRGPAQSLPLPDGSIDYCFTDPPFGSNIFYADCAVVWESWLGEVTDTTAEAVVNRSLKPDAGGKTVDDYADLMAAAFAEIHRVVKPGAWTTIVFQSSDADVWSALRVAIEAAGFDVASATHIDKTQQSFKGYKGRSGKENVAAFDVVINARKQGVVPRRRTPARGIREAGDLIEQHLRSLPPIGADSETDRQRTLPYLHSLLVQAHFNGDIGLEVGAYSLVRRVCEQRFENRDGMFISKETAGAGAE